MNTDWIKPGAAAVWCVIDGLRVPCRVQAIIPHKSDTPVHMCTYSEKYRRVGLQDLATATPDEAAWIDQHIPMK